MVWFPRKTFANKVLRIQAKKNEKKAKKPRDEMALRVTIWVANSVAEQDRRSRGERVCGDFPMDAGGRGVEYSRAPVWEDEALAEL